MSIRIKKVDNNDPLIQLMLKDMDKECFPSEGEAPPMVESGDWWVALDGKTPVAYACLRPSKQRPGWGYLSRAGVIESHRGKGLQRRLITTRIQHAKRENYYGLVTDTVKMNVNSSNNLIRSGFTLFRPAEPWSFDSALYWQLPFEATRRRRT